MLKAITVKPVRGVNLDAKKDATVRIITMMYARIEQVGYILSLETAYERWETLKRSTDLLATPNKF